jgi:hypothetical protein
MDDTARPRAAAWPAAALQSSILMTIAELPNVPELHDDFTRVWHENPDADTSAGELERLIVAQHRQNFALWHEEDRARSPVASFEEVAAVKRSIDVLNQARNDLIEAFDSELLRRLKDDGVSLAGPLHSETPGMMVDRLSILSLKIFHTRQEIEREGVRDAHRAKNRERLTILKAQRGDLADCLRQLWREVREGTRQFKLYRQLKMYNDPELNPEIYKTRHDG